MTQTTGLSLDAPKLPDWVPPEAFRYLAHTETGLSIRALARSDGLSPSTVSRQIKRFEQRRDCMLIDAALQTLGDVHFAANTSAAQLQDCLHMTAQPRNEFPKDTSSIEREARRILRRLTEPNALLGVSADMEKAVVLRTNADGETHRTAVVDRTVAEAFALKDWISCTNQGRIVQYRITAAGRSALKRMLAEDSNQRMGLSEAQSPFAQQHGEWAEKSSTDEDGARKTVRYNRSECPVGSLARRRGPDGKPFLSAELVRTADRLREDFELAQMGPRVTQNWDSFLTGGNRGGFSNGAATGPEACRDRVAAALRDLGPGLGDMVLRCCCFLEGLEATEKRLGWSARSGKVVLRIALQRLKRHYDETYGPGGGLIG